MENYLLNLLPSKGFWNKIMLTEKLINKIQDNRINNKDDDTNSSERKPHL